MNKIRILKLLFSFAFLLPGSVSLFAGPSYKILYDSTFVKVEASGLSKVDNFKRYRVLEAEASKSLSHYILDYDPLSAWVEFREVILHRNGEEINIDISAVMDYPAPARMIYWGARQKMLEIGRLYPGDELEIHWFRKGFTYALLHQEDDERYIPPMRGHFYDIVDFYASVPIDKKVYELSVPADKELQYKFYNGKVEAEQRIVDSTRRYSFKKENILPLKREPYMVALSDVAPKLLLSTSPDWEAKSVWFYDVNEDYGSFEWDAEIKQKVDEILQGATSEIDSISRLTHWVADEIRYSGISMGEGEGYTLHKGSMTFRDRCGVCKDKAGMLITMLRAAGFESYAAMTMAGSRIEDIPADQFNHSVTVVKMKNGNFRLLDPTWVPFVRELWSSAEQQQNYLMGIPGGADLMITDVSPPQAHYLRLTGYSNIEEDGSLSGGFSLSAEGQSDAAVRRMFTSSLRNTWMARIESALQDAHPAAELVYADYGDPYDYSEPILLRIEYRVPDFAKVSAEKIVFTPFLLSAPFRRAMAHLHYDLHLEERQFPFRDRCSREVSISDVVRVPEFSEIAYAPQPQILNTEIGDFEGRINSRKEREITADIILRLNKRVYEPTDWPSYREIVKWHKKYSSEPIILSR